MTKSAKKIILSLGTAVVLCVFSNSSLAAPNPANLIQSSILLAIDAAQMLDKSTGELAKNFGISYNEAAGLSNELNSAANNSYLLNITTQGLTEAFIALNNQFGRNS